MYKNIFIANESVKEFFPNDKEIMKDIFKNNWNKQVYFVGIETDKEDGIFGGSYSLYNEELNQVLPEMELVTKVIEFGGFIDRKCEWFFSNKKSALKFARFIKKHSGIKELKFWGLTK